MIRKYESQISEVRLWYIKSVQDIRYEIQISQNMLTKKKFYNMRYDFKISEIQLIITKLACDKKCKSHIPEI